MTTVPTTTDSTTTRLAQIGDVELRLLTTPENAPQLALAADTAEIIIGGPATAAALAAALQELDHLTTPQPAIENRGEYSCGSCSYTIIDDSDDVDGFWDLVDAHEAHHDYERELLPAHLKDLDPNADAYAEQGKARAAAIGCDVPGCDQSGHDWQADPAEWVHRVLHTDHLGLEVDVFAELPQGELRAYVFAHLEDRTGNGRDAEGLRALAVQLRIQAEQLLEDADIMERRARRIRRPVDVADALRDLEG
ncbi:MAG: hypothetical protein DI573_14000 [Microbacterium sp.]|uniref:hypothetical protein n=1 Tax=Microbacterium sp. TaxID=51671 RepID=UPI000DB45BB9|nr:hypothetical protein [Microbacterium sp.]PZU36285.1 MAG: hypothetical protein DI573_14000 [Microbacterium sp.]